MKKIIIIMLFFTMIIVPYITSSISAKETIEIKPIEYINVLVGVGDTLWSISEKYRGEREHYTFMTMIQQLNNMSHTVVREGSYIKIPVF